MNRILGILLALALVLSLGLATTAPVAAGVVVNDEVWVCNSGSDDTGDGSEGDPYATIQHGIDVVAEGGTVNVKAGTYNENVDVNKSLSLLGAQAGAEPALHGRNGGESLITTNRAHGLRVLADDVVVDGFEIVFTNRDAINIAGPVSGGASPARSNIQILNNYIHTAGVSAGQANGIVIGETVTGDPHREPGQAEFRDITIDSNLFHITNETAVRGIALTNHYDSIIYVNFLIQANVFHVNATALGYGIFVGADPAAYEADEFRIMDNTFDVAAGDYGPGINMGNLDGSSQINDNRFIGGTHGAQVGWRELGGELLDNEFENLTNTALLFWDDEWFPAASSAATVTGNDFANNARQVRDLSGNFDLEAILANNTFDRAVVVRGSDIKVPTIFSSIQDGIDAADTGDIVNVLAGQYDDPVNINVEGLALKGAQAGADGRDRDPEDLDNETIVSVPGDKAFVVEADDVTIDGFTFKESQWGIHVPAGEEFSGTQVLNNMFLGNERGGLRFHNEGNSAKPALIQYNLFIETSGAPAGAIFIGDGDAIAEEADQKNIVIDSNKFVDNAHSTINIAALTSSIDITVSNNVFEETASEPNVFAVIVIGDSDGVEISGNTFTDTVGIPIYFVGGADNTEIIGNLIEGGASWAIAVLRWDFGVYEGEMAENTNLTITGNTIRNNETGGIVLVEDAYDDSVLINHNNIYDNGNSGYGVRADGPETVDATDNWWGHGTGPFHETENPDGQGDAVSDNVNFRPWIGLVEETEPGTGEAYFTPDQGLIEDLAALPEIPPGAPDDVTFPHGMFEFRITGLTPGETVTLTIELPDPGVDPDFVWWKYDEATGQWHSLDITIVDDHTIQLELTDGDYPGDLSGVADGTIIDPGGPGNPEPPLVLPPVGGTGHLVNRLVLLAPWLALAAVVAGALVFVRRRHAQS